MTPGRPETEDGAHAVRPAPVPVRASHRPGAAAKAAGLAVGLAFVAAASVVLAQISSPRGRDLVVPEYNEKAVQAGQLTNQLKGQLRLKEVEYLPNRLVRGRHMQLDQYAPDGRTNVAARAPECYFDERSRTAWSTGRLEIIARDGWLEVVGRGGFQVSLTNTTLLLSNRVRTVIKQNLLKP